MVMINNCANCMILDCMNTIDFGSECNLVAFVGKCIFTTVLNGMAIYIFLYWTLFRELTNMTTNN